MNQKVSILSTICLLICLSNPVLSQSSFADFEETDKKVSQEVEKFLGVLNGEDTGRAVRAVQYMLSSDNKELVRAAKEFGLFSPNSDVKAETLRAIFDQGGPFKILLELSAKPDKETQMIKYLKYIKAGISVDETQGTIFFNVGKYSTEKSCWPFRGNLKNCALKLAGTTVSLDGWSYATGSLTLDDEGRLQGSIQYTGKPVPAVVTLLD